MKIFGAKFSFSRMKMSLLCMNFSCHVFSSVKLFVRDVHPPHVKGLLYGDCQEYIRFPLKLLVSSLCEVTNEY